MKDKPKGAPPLPPRSEIEHGGEADPGGEGIGYFLKRLDSPEAKEANGKSILENSLITVSTESGDGRHSDPKRELSGVFHAISGANGRFKTGQFIDVGKEGLDVYNTMLDAMEVRSRLGPKDRDPTAADRIRA